MSQATSQAAHHTISYIEFTTASVATAKKFYAAVFGWSFTDYGPEYASFAAAEAGVNGGFMQGQTAAAAGGPLVVLYSADLEATEKAVVAAGGTIVTPTFAFPGGRRFHFNDGAGNVLAVWSE